ncbi:MULTISPECIES: mechanosensitive ion channel family protein [unclassified Solwaraspora]|uniref:mechanosensitive ion channel family protein n=1 Tax=unclassified Solwaraspora TaxID=2627926 RepID=UPI00248B19AC|nr:MULTISPECIES: mechanosensitive ion channel family protein [unclassified Solwaraspora]WBC21629.1 mechanosensitive ion channel family protein [Solwaraspora sp. WMMA2080]WJK36312.1 mechanosensitive ion channel family protein [Solwaraspora sp. WMMA2065]
MSDVSDALVSAAIVIGSAAAAALAVTVVYRILRFAGRRSTLLTDISRRAFWPTAIIAALLAARFTIPIATTNGWHEPVQHAILLATIATGGWLVATLLGLAADTALRRFPIDVNDNLAARRAHTQITVIRRVAFAVVGVLTVGAMLITFPGARAAGASVLASAGLVGVVAALAAQSTLGNIFAGLQLAFGDALRLDDVVVVEGEWGRIEEMTLGYVVVKIWDERRLILPSNYFTTTPFQNWTRTASSVLGTAEIDVDWSLPVESMRQELRRIVESEAAAPLWDGRVCGLQVTGATDGNIRTRALVSAANSSALWDLRCLVREQLVAWVQEQHPQSRPRVRAEVGGHDGGTSHPAAPLQRVNLSDPAAVETTPGVGDQNSSADHR